MEPERRYFMVGVFVVTIVVAALVFVIWLAGIRSHGDYNLYQSFFTESVNGLGQGAPVKFRGVDVGKVNTIEIDKRDPANIRIVMQINKDTPITVGTTSTLQMQGITGTSYIELKGALAGQALLEPSDKHDIPTIPVTPSPLSQIVNSVPEILSKVLALTNKLNDFVSDDNAAHFSNLMANLDRFSEGVGGENGGMSLITELRETTEQIGKAAKSLNDIATTSKGDAQRILKNTSVTIDKINNLVDTTGQISKQSGQDLQGLLIEMKKTARDIQDLSKNIKENPSQIVIPQQQGGVKVSK